MMFRLALITCITVAPLVTSARDLPLQVVAAGTGEPLPDAVVFLPQPWQAEVSTATMEQENRQFVPHVLVIPPDTSVNFPNRDSTQHHVYSFSPVKTFEIELYAGTPEAPVHFDATGVVELGCNIHDHMQGFILVTDRQHGVTDAQGRVALPWHDDRPVPGQLEAWHPRLHQNSEPVLVTVAAPSDGPLTLTLEVQPAPQTDSSLQRLQQRFREL